MTTATETRLNLVHQAQEITDRADGRPLTQEEQNRWDALWAGIDGAGMAADRERRMLAGPEPSLASRRRFEADSGPFSRYLRSGVLGLTPADRRALQMDSDNAGGYLISPQQFSDQLVKFIDDLVFIRQFATVVPVMKAESLGVPSLETDVADAVWTTELGTGTEDSSTAFGKRELRPHPIAKRIKVSWKLLRAAKNAEAIIQQRLAYKLSIVLEKGYMTGTGAEQPLGIFTASAMGISTGRDVSTGNTTSSITGDGLIEAKWSIKGAYWKNLVWLFHRDALKQIRKAKDANGQYVYRAGIAGLASDTILDSPYLLSEYVPNTFTTGLYVGAICDLSRYWIADAAEVLIQRLSELYVETNQAGFICRFESDGCPAVEEAFARVKLA